MLERDARPRRSGVTVDRIFCNGLYPERFADAEAERLAERPPRRDGAVRAPPAARRSASAAARPRQREQLARLEELAEAPVTTLPFIFEPELGIEEIAALGESCGG